MAPELTALLVAKHLFQSIRNTLYPFREYTYTPTDESDKQHGTILSYTNLCAGPAQEASRRRISTRFGFLL